MSKKILIDAVYPGETRVVIHDKNRIQDFDYENSHKKQLKGKSTREKVALMRQRETGFRPSDAELDEAEDKARMIIFGVVALLLFIIAGLAAYILFSSKI